MAKKIIIIATLVLISTSLWAQLVSSPSLLSFESTTDGLVATFSTIHRSPDHFKDGISSLKWTYGKGASLTYKADLAYVARQKGERDLYLSTFVVWIYREAPSTDSLIFAFGKDGRECCHFAMGQNYTGWRAAWVCYQRDMQGEPEEGMNELTMTFTDAKGAASKSKGTVYIDHLLTAVKADPRHQSADRQVPFVNSANDNHWLRALKMSAIKPDTTITTLSKKTQKEISEIESRLTEVILSPVKADEKLLAKLRSQFEAYRIVRTKGRISGKPLFFTRASEAYERLEVPGWKTIFEDNGMELRAYFNLMKRIANAWHSADGEVKDELGDMFIDMYDHVTDQGVADGSCLGNITHYGYSFRDMYPAYFLMKEELRRRGKLEEASATLRWYAMTNEVFIAPKTTGIDVDELNTKVTGTLASILIMPASTEKEAYLRRFARRLDIGCRPSEGLSGGFKRDGAVFHHRNNYPAYATGGLTGAVNMVYALHGTSFAFSEESHNTIREALLLMRFYCNRIYYPLALSGRHPDGKGTIHPYQFGRMALSGTPDGSAQLDTLMASAFMRLVKDPHDKLSTDERAFIKTFKAAGVKAERDPRGQRTIAYGCTSIHRRGGWEAVVRGHSRYLWASEHYVKDNFYGRYLANGSLQILYTPKGTPDMEGSAAWREEGFNWNRIPGATGVNLPLESEDGPSLRARIYNVDKASGYEEMLLSDEAFAGGLDTPDGNGNFAMILHGHDKYDGTLRARKSYHFLGGQIVCLGSGISDADADHNTETTILQTAGTVEPVWNGNILTDCLGTQYFVSSLENVVVEYNPEQESRNEGDGHLEKGPWSTVYIDHGKAPQGASYEYAILPVGKRDFAYEVLRRDDNAHVVKDSTLKTVSYCIFEPQTALPGQICEAGTPLLAMVRGGGRTLRLTVANPDLALYEGPADEILDENGHRRERSVYSRSWIDNPSKEISTTLTLRGLWKIEEGEGAEIVSCEGGRTTLLFHCKDGKSITLKLVKR